jgi:putative nucleotidyltransferase with HDIG domain
MVQPPTYDDPDASATGPDMPSRAEALELMHEHTGNENLRKHMYAVEAAMRAYAEEEDADVVKWGITGLLHDFDYEKWPNEEREPDEEHPARGVGILREEGYPDDVCRAILAHAPYTGIPADTRMARTLRAVDELTGFIVACALVRPNGIMDLEPPSVRKKMRDASFASGVDRDHIREAVDELGVEMDDHIAFVTEAMRGIVDTLELRGHGGDGV